jgi:hypothetical protein
MIEFAVYPVEPVSPRTRTSIFLGIVIAGSVSV